MDFFAAPTITFGVLYGFFVISHDRRRIPHFNVTKHPPSSWIIQQLREAFPFESESRFLIRGEIPRLSRGGSRSLTGPAVCFTILAIVMYRPGRCRTRFWLLLLIGCDQVPLRGQQP